MRYIFILGLFLFGCDDQSPKPGISPSPSKTVSPSPTVSPTASPSPSITPSPTTTPTPSVTPSPTPSKPQFPIGVWFQPVSSFPKWKIRGVNTMFGPEVGNPPTMTEAQYVAQAKDFKLVGNFTARWPNLLAVMMPDEFDCKTVDGKGQSVDWVKQRSQLLLSGVPHFCSFCGDHLSISGNKPRYVAYAPYCDLVSEDWYPITRDANRYPIALVGTSVSNAKTWTGKPVWAIIETCHQHLKGTPNGRQITAAEFAQTLEIALSSGASGIAYFPDYFDSNSGGWRGYDCTPPEIEAEMIKFAKSVNP